MARARPENQAADRMAVLADPMRRAIFEILAEGPSSVGEIAERLPVTRPAVSQHLRALSDVGLVTHESVGTRHLYRIEPDRVAEVRDYLDRLWQKALANLKTRIEKPNQRGTVLGHCRVSAFARAALAKPEKPDRKTQSVRSCP